MQVDLPQSKNSFNTGLTYKGYLKDRSGLDEWDWESKDANTWVMNESTLIINIAIFQRCQWNKGISTMD